MLSFPSARLHHIRSLCMVGLFLLGACARPAGPVTIEPDAPAARVGTAAVEQFHAQFASAKYAEMCQLMDPGALLSVTQLPCTDFLTYVHDHLGIIIDTRLKGLPMLEITAGNVTRVGLNYATTFDHDKAEEHFEWRAVGSKTVLTSYRIQADALSR